MKKPVEIYLFPFDDSIVWADTDESEDGQGVKYIRADTLNEIKAQVIEEMLSKQKQKNIEWIEMGGVSDHRKCLPFGLIREYANKLRGEE
jgi:hypothetical protein